MRRMIKSKLFSELCEEYRDLCAALYSRQLLLDSIPYLQKQTSETSYTVTWSGRNSSNTILFDEGKSCSELISTLRTERQYSLLLYDKSIIQAEYIIEKEELKKARLIFIKLQNKVWSMEEIAEFSNDPDLLDDCLNEPTGLPIMFRLDYDPENHKDCEHPKAHFVFNNIRDCRIPLKAPMSLGQFTDFILQQVYHIKIQELPYICFNKTITDNEQCMVHINW